MTKLLSVLLLAASAFANPITFQAFAFQQTAPFKVLLGEGLNPLLTPEFGGEHVLSFLALFVLPGENTFSATLDLPQFQKTFESTENCDIPPYQQCGIVSSFDFIPIRYKPTSGTVTMTLDGTSKTYNFQYAMPVPEPASLVLFGCGLVGVGVRKWQRYSDC